ncbi:hypothetical protein QJS66_04185 [Kocuria rhizophila]|nr:hypothetical protein QJS66_04185 [Kocuria rhizophila]
MTLGAVREPRDTPPRRRTPPGRAWRLPVLVRDGDTRYLDDVLNQVRRIDGVYDVDRVSGHRPVAS